MAGRFILIRKMAFTEGFYSRLALFQQQLCAYRSVRSRQSGGVFCSPLRSMQICAACADLVR